MSKENGFAPIRRGLWEHIRDGRMSHLEALAFVYICSQADTRTGMWKGSAGALVAELGFKPRTARDVLERMERGDYIRRFAKPGERFCYPILVHKFPITQGEHNGEVVDALSSRFSNGCVDAKYFSCEVHGEVHGQVGASQRRKENREKRKEKKEEAQATPSPSFEGKHFLVSQKQDALLRDAFPWIDRLPEYRRADSWLAANPERRPKKTNRFLHNWFSRITEPKGRSNGQLTAEELRRKRTEITPEGRAILEKAGGVIQ